jgi:hypothetical protein
MRGDIRSKAGSYLSAALRFDGDNLIACGQWRSSYEQHQISAHCPQMLCSHWVFDMTCAAGASNVNPEA